MFLKNRLALVSLVQTGLANMLWTDVSNQEMAYMWMIAQLVRRNALRAFWLEPLVAGTRATSSSTCILDALVQQVLHRSGQRIPLDRAIRSMHWLSALLGDQSLALRDKALAHVFSLPLIDATQHGALPETLEWLATRRVQPLAQRAMPANVSPNSVSLARCGAAQASGFPQTCWVGNGMWFDVEPAWLTHVTVELQKSTSTSVEFAVYAVVYETTGVDDVDHERDGALPAGEFARRRAVRDPLGPPLDGAGDVPDARGARLRPTLVCLPSSVASEPASLALAPVPGHRGDVAGYAPRVGVPTAIAVIPFEQTIGLAPYQHSLSESAAQLARPYLPSVENAREFAHIAGLSNAKPAFDVHSAAAAAPVRDLRWHFEENDGSFHPCDAASSNKLEMAFQAQQKTLNYTSGAHSYQADLKVEFIYTRLFIEFV